MGRARRAARRRVERTRVRGALPPRGGPPRLLACRSRAALCRGARPCRLASAMPLRHPSPSRRRLGGPCQSLEEHECAARRLARWMAAARVPSLALNAAAHAPDVHRRPASSARRGAPLAAAQPQPLRHSAGRNRHPRRSPKTSLHPNKSSCAGVYFCCRLRLRRSDDCVVASQPARAAAPEAASETRGRCPAASVLSD